MTVRRPTGFDRHGDPVAPAAEHRIAACALAPQSSDEIQDNRDTVVTRYTLYAPYGADIRVTDTVVLPGGAECQVRGEPFAWSSPYSGWRAGTTVQLERVTG